MKVRKISLRAQLLRFALKAVNALPARDIPVAKVRKRR
jgi:hypothetical protein